MARIKYNSLISDIRGRLGSLVFSSNNTGGYVKEFVPPVKKRSGRTSGARSAFSTASQIWSGLPNPLKEEWYTYSKNIEQVRYNWFGDPFFLSSRASFISYWLIASRSQEVPSLAPPAGPKPSPITSANALFSTAGGAFSSFFEVISPVPLSFDWIHLKVLLWSSTSVFSPPRPLLFLALLPSSSGPVFDLTSYVQTLYPHRFASMTWFLEATPYSAEFRQGTSVFLTNVINSESSF